MTREPVPSRRTHGLHTRQRRQARQRLALIVVLASLIVGLSAYAVHALETAAGAFILTMLAFLWFMAGVGRAAFGRETARPGRSPYTERESEMTESGHRSMAARVGAFFGFPPGDGEPENPPTEDDSQESVAARADSRQAPPLPLSRPTYTAQEQAYPPQVHTPQAYAPQAPVGIPVAHAQPTAPPASRMAAPQPAAPQMGPSQAAAPPTTVPPTGLPGDPPVFVGTSAAGQAPWHLPGGSVSGGLSADAATLGDLQVRAASVVGPGHRCEEPAGPRQDAYSLRRTPDGEFLIVAVADGVGSSRHSDLGARVAVTTATRELEGMLQSAGFSGIDVAPLYKSIAGEMIGTGRSRGFPDKDICSILITAVIPARPETDGYRSVWVAWIGDVSMWLAQGGALHQLTGHQKAGLDRNALQAVLPFEPGEVQYDTFSFALGDRIALMTDGVSDSLTTIPEAVGYLAAQWSGPPPHPAAFLHSLCYDSPGQADDRTAVVVWCGPPVTSPDPRAQGWGS